MLLCRELRKRSATGAVRVTGARFISGREIHRENRRAPRWAGYRSIVVAGIRDPLVLRQLDTFSEWSSRPVLERKNCGQHEN